MRTLSAFQLDVLARMRKLGLNWSASAVEASWKRGETYYFDMRDGPMPKELRNDYQQANEEVRKED